MKLLSSTYGKGRVRVMRVAGEGDYREVRELEVRAMLAGDIGRAFTAADNSTTVSTDTIKNVVNIVARENPGRNSSAAPWPNASSTATPA